MATGRTSMARRSPTLARALRHCETKSDWLATVRGRAGYAWDRILFYGTGGVAFGNVQAERVRTLQQRDTSRLDRRRGVEFAFTPNWTAKVEYLYVDLGNRPARHLRRLLPALYDRLAHRERRPRRHQLQVLVTGLGSEPAIRQSDKRAIQTLLWALKPLLNLRLVHQG